MDVNLTNEHGNTPLHYACFWSYQGIADDLIQAGGIVTIANRFGTSPWSRPGRVAGDSCGGDWLWGGPWG